MKNVLLIDSGSGGVNILRQCVKICPNCNYMLFCDNKNLPYGQKSKEELIDITCQNLDFLREIFPFEVVVFACNTLTSTCIDFCREKYANVQFVGTEPAIKPALEKFREDEIVVLATHATLEHNKLLRKHPNLRCVQMDHLATLIDENLDNLESLEGYLREKLCNISAKALVLGCTHYVAVVGSLQKIFPNAEIFDGASGVARQVKRIVGCEGQEYQVKIVTSQDGQFWAKLWNYFNQS
jgi:glutamate racemase